MAGHSWSIRTPEAHLVEVEHAIHSARVKIKVDGEIIFSQSGHEPLCDTGFSHDFIIDGRRCSLTIQGIGSKKREYDLDVGYWPFIGT